MKIAIISVHGCPLRQIGYGSSGGMNVFILESSKFLSSVGVDIDIFTRCHDHDGPSVVDLTERCRVIHLEAGTLDLGKDEIYEWLPEFSEKVVAYNFEKNENYDLIVSHYWLSGLVGSYLKKVWNIKHVTTFHTLSLLKSKGLSKLNVPSIRKNGEKKVIEQSDAILVWSEHEKQSLVEYYGAASEKIDIIKPGVDVGLLKPTEMGDNEFKSGELKILFVGRLEPIKGVETIVRAVSNIDNDKITVSIFGGDSVLGETNRLTALCRELNVKNRVSFFGPIDRQLLPNIYRNHDLLIMPSYYESFGLSALEAQSSGIPVIASHVGGLSEVVVSGTTGFLIQPADDHVQFSNKIEILTSDTKLRRAMGTNARQHAESFSWQLKGIDLLKVYCSKVEKNPFISTACEKILATL